MTLSTALREQSAIGQIFVGSFSSISTLSPSAKAVASTDKARGELDEVGR